jgi:TP901 family phage tail tape measure protein
MPTLQLAIDSRKAKDGADTFVRATDNVQKSAKRVDQALKQNRDEFGRFAKAAQESAYSLKSVLAWAASGIAVGYGTKEAFSQVANFEQRLAEIQGVTQAASADMKRLEEAARVMGVTSQYSATQAAEAMLNLSKAGYTVTESIQSVDEVLSLAQAHGLDLGRSSEILIAAMRTFGLTTEEATRVVDSFSSAANLSSADVEDLAKALEFAGPFANALGLSLEEVNATLGVLSNVMIRGAKGGTAVRAVLEALANPSRIARGAFEQLGVSVDDVNPQLHSMSEIFALLRERGMSAVQAVRIFGVEAASASLALADNAEQIDEYVRKQHEMAGSTAELAKIMAQTPLGALGRLLAAIREIVLVLGRDSGLSGAFVTATYFLRDSLLVAFTDFGGVIASSRDKVQEFIRIMEALAAATITRLAVPALALLASGVRTVALAVKSLTLAMAANPIGLLLTAISAGVATLIYFKDSIIEMGDKSFSVMDLLTASWEHFVEVLKFAADVARLFWNSTLLPILTAAKDATVRVFKDIGTAADILLGYFGSDWKSAISGAVNFSIASFMTMKDAFSAVFNAIVSGVKAIASIDWTNKASIAVGAMNLINAFNPEAIGSELADRTVSNFSKDWVQELKTAAEEGWEAFSTAWAAFASTDIGKRIDTLFNPVSAFQSITERANALRLERETALAAADAETEVATAMKRSTEEVIAATDAVQELSSEREEGIALLNGWASDLRWERLLVGQTTAAQERMNLAREAEAVILNAQIENGREHLDVLQEELYLLQQARGNDWYEEYLANVRSDIRLVNLSNDQREIAIALRQAEEYGLDNNVAAMGRYLTVLEKELVLLQKMAQIKQLANNIGDAFSYALGDIVIEAKNANEALNDLLKTIYRLLFNEIVGKPLASAISSGLFGIFGGLLAPAAQGMVVAGGAITPMAAGGIVRSPTRVPMANGSALLGEQGAEAVFPLTRLPDGRLGLSADTGGQSSSPVINFYITTPNPDSFRRARHQIASDIGRAVNRAQGTS